MREYTKFYINGQWVEPAEKRTLDVINPATEKPVGTISLGSEVDVDRAVEAARTAFESFSRTSREERVTLLERIAGEYQKRLPDMAAAITEEMGAPTWLAEKAQAPAGLAHIMTAAQILKEFPFEEVRGRSTLAKEPIGVCGLITPWNWPSNQISCKVAPALAVGCTMVLKPSEVAPFSGVIWAEILDAAGVPAGVFNLVNGDGPTVGAAIARHPKIDMVSFTGSTRAGIAVAENAAASVKRVHQELGGKSPNIILEDADMAEAVGGGIMSVMMNSGQSCNAPTRMLVPRAKMDEAVAIAKATIDQVVVGDPHDKVRIGPVVSETQWNKIQALIEKGIAEGATLVAGGPGKPDGLDTGYYVRPTVFTDVNNDMTIAREEIFGPVLVMIPYDSIDEAIRIGNDTEYGLAAYVQGTDMERVKDVARQLRAGQVLINNAPQDFNAPFGGYKKSGNGREWGDLAFDEFLEVKSIVTKEAS